MPGTGGRVAADGELDRRTAVGQRGQTEHRHEPRVLDPAGRPVLLEGEPQREGIARPCAEDAEVHLLPLRASDAKLADQRRQRIRSKRKAPTPRKSR